MEGQRNKARGGTQRFRKSRFYGDVVPESKRQPDTDQEKERKKIDAERKSDAGKTSKRPTGRQGGGRRAKREGKLRGSSGRASPKKER